MSKVEGRAHKVSGTFATKLWQGLGTKKREATYNNNIVILIEISGGGFWKVETEKDRLETKEERKMNALLAGDCPFDNMPKR